MSVPNKRKASVNIQRDDNGECNIIGVWGYITLPILQELDRKLEDGGFSEFEMKHSGLYTVEVEFDNYHTQKFRIELLTYYNFGVMNQ